MSNNQQPQHSDIIVRADAKSKIIDFRNGLVQAFPAHYAMLHGVGGKEYAPISVIKMYLTDYSRGIGNGSAITVSASVTPDIFEQIKAVCLRNIGNEVIETPGIAGGVAATMETQQRIFNAIGSLIQTKMSHLAKFIKSQSATPYEKDYSAQGANLKNAKAALLANDNPIELPPGESYTNFTYSQQRVNIYSNNNGFVDCSVCQIARYQKTDKGDTRKLPWTIKVTNFKAKPVEHQGGTITYDKSSVKDQKEVFINLSDSDMFRCCYRIDHFVTVWENAMCIPMVKAGSIERDQIRQSYNNNNR